MSAVWMRAVHELRSRWRGVVVLVILLGVAGGVVMTAAAGARRTATAFDRLLRESKAYDVEVSITGDTGPEILDDVAALPQVVDQARIAFIPSTEATPGKDRKPFGWDVSSVALVDPNLGRTLEIPTMIAGRFPRPDAPLEAMASETFARLHRLTVGNTFSLQLATFPELLQLFEGRPVPPTGPVASVRIVGIGNIPHDVSISEPRGILTLTPAFFETYGERSAHLWALLVKLRNGDADVPAFIASGRTIATESAAERGISAEEVLGFRSTAQASAGVDRALGVQASALWILAGVVGAAALLVLGQAVGRWLTIGADEHPVLRALGMGPYQRAAATALPIAAVAAGACLLAVITAVASSPLIPVGLARRIEPDPGVFADGTVLALGGAALLLLVTAWGSLHAVVLARRARVTTIPARRRPSVAADLAARRGMPPTIVTGVRFGLEPGRGRSAVPVRSVLLGTTLAIVTVVGAFVFGQSLEHMLSTPATYGWNWDLILFGGEGNPALTAELEQKLAASPSVEEFSSVEVKTTTFRGRDLETLGVEPIKGSVLPVVLDGRYPTSENEVALATKTMREAGIRLGDGISFPGSQEECGGAAFCSVRFRVVGTVVHWGEGADPDDGAAFTSAGQARLRRSEGFLDFAIRVAQGRDTPAVLRDLERELGDATDPILGPNLSNVARVRSMPTLIASILAALALVTLVHALLTTSRRRRYDLAVLKTLGFIRRQVTSTVAWQATTLVVLALAVGVPIGIVAGRWAWTLLASRLGVAEVHVISPLWIFTGAVATVLLANLVALLPGRAAARTQPALVLRSE